MKGSHITSSGTERMARKPKTRYFPIGWSVIAATLVLGAYAAAILLVPDEISDFVDGKSSGATSGAIGSGISWMISAAGLIAIAALSLGWIVRHSNASRAAVGVVILIGTFAFVRNAAADQTTSEKLVDSILWLVVSGSLAAGCREAIDQIRREHGHVHKPG